MSRVQPPAILPGADQRRPWWRVVEMNVFFQWNDMIDPNNHFTTDEIKDAVAHVVTLGARSSYRISVTWNEQVKVALDDNGHVVESSGYPFE